MFKAWSSWSWVKPVIASAAPVKGLGKDGTCPSSGTGNIRSKSEMLVDEVAGDTGPALSPRGGAMLKNGLVGSGLKGGTGIARGDVLNGMQD